ncbi:MAG: putative aminopeptidase FrvX [Rhodothermales bacterium]|jgi:putative aminopeptidase FrvX
MPRLFCPIAFSLCLLLLAVPQRAASQVSKADLLASWIALDAPTGHEHLATQPLMARFPGWQLDRAGNMVRTVGSGSPHRVVACGLDANAYLVTQITDDGYLRLHRVGRGSAHRLWDQEHEGQHLRILTRSGPVLGVSAVANGHFASQHRGETDVVTQDDLWVDVGVDSPAEVSEAGISLLDPVVRQLPAWAYAGEVAGPNAGARVGCAAVVAAAESGVAGVGQTTYALTTQQTMEWIGLGAALRFLGDVDEVILVGPGEESAAIRTDSEMESGLQTVIEVLGVENVITIAPEVASPGALMERVSVAAADALLATLVGIIDPSSDQPQWLAAPAPPPVRNPLQNAESVIDAAERQLDGLAELSAVAGHEGPIRHRVRAALPEWARAIAQTDEMGNLWVEVGPTSGEATVFIAHLDEVGFQIGEIEASGVVHLDRTGGPVRSAWEGQPAVIQLDAGEGLESALDYEELRGVFLTRSDPVEKRPGRLQAWFGLDGAGLAEAGVTPGMGVTGYKEGHRVGPTRYAARSLDDRVGTTALLLAVQQIDPQAMEQRVVFAWSVQEEVGLFGAERLARTFGTQARRVYSIDTFVSSDTPLESPHFAYAKLGQGPVLRSAENSGLVVPSELDRNRRVAANAGIEVQIGLTQGGTDGTTFSFFGAPNAGLSWPGRYSHSPAEIADLNDVVELVELIKAFAMAKDD